MQQVVDRQAVATIAAADREEQPTVAEHQLAECFCVLHAIITNFDDQKLQTTKKVLRQVEVRTLRRTCWNGELIELLEGYAGLV